MIVKQAPKGATQIDEAGVKATVLRKEINARHPEWVAKEDLRFLVSVLYEGGDKIKQHASRFLEQRPREDSAVYQYRLNQFCYENNLGTGLGWHEAEMFKDQPKVDIKVGDAGKPSADQDDYYSRFQKNCDRTGKTLVDKYRKVFTDLLLHGVAWILTDFPEAPARANFAEQVKAGDFDPYIQVVSPLDVINWQTDSAGNLDWVVMYTKTQTQQFLGKPIVKECWYFYDRQTFREYERVVDNDVSGGDADEQPVTCSKVGYHALYAKNTVPLQRIELQSGWWLGNRAYLPAMEHVNISNALKWSLFMAAHAQPVVITSDDLSNLITSEAGFIQLPEGAKYQFAEPTGVCWKYLAERAEVLKEEIWRSLYLIAQSRSTSATASAQSGVSKQQDMKPSHQVLNGMGDLLRAAMQETLQNIAVARASVPNAEADAELQFVITGFQHDDPMTSEDVDTLTGLHALRVPSPLFEKAVDKQIVTQALPDLKPEEREAMFAEIDAAPTRAEVEEQQKEADAQRMRDDLNAAVAA